MKKEFGNYRIMEVIYLMMMEELENLIKQFLKIRIRKYYVYHLKIMQWKI